MAGYLNAAVEFASLSQEVRDAFLGHRADKRLLPVGMALYKYTDHPLIDDQGRISPWWSSAEPVAADDPGFAGSAQRAERLGVSGDRFARAQAAVTREWNGMSRLMWAELTQPVWGFAGRCRHQRVSKADPKVFFIGGAYQVYIPDLTRGHVRSAANLSP